MVAQVDAKPMVNGSSKANAKVIKSKNQLRRLKQKQRKVDQTEVRPIVT